MNSKTQHQKVAKKISRRESLPLLRGMFVAPEQTRHSKNNQSQVNHSSSYGDGLILSAREGMYLGE
jgi:hypothetical protein